VAQGAIGIEIWKSDSTISAPRDVMRTACVAAIGSQSPDLSPAGEF
jgi:hypothetical protein